MNIHCLGDSITQAGGLPESGRWTVCLQALLNAWRPGEFDVYTNGVGGDTTAMGLERMKREELDTGITLIEFGFNDAACRVYGSRPRVGMEEYRANLVSMGKIVRRRGGRPVYILNHDCNFKDAPEQADGRRYTVKVGEYREACREVAQSMEAPVVDLPKLMAERSIAPEDFYKDGVHLHAKGNQLYAEMVFSVLRDLI